MGPINNNNPSTLQSDQINALQQHIQRVADQLAKQSSDNNNDDDVGSLIYMGNLHDSFPRELITDPILNSDEIHTWMLMRLEVSDQYSITRIPNQSTLMAQLKCSRPIVSRNLQVLRAMRWITLCQIVRGPNGQYKGAVYAQHDSPLPLAETLMLDNGYLHFLQEETKSDVYKRLDDIKRAVLKHTDYRLLTDDTVLEPENRILTAISHLTRDDDDNPLATKKQACPPNALEPKNEINCYESDQIPHDVRLALRTEDKKPDQSAHHVKNINMADHVKNINTVESSHVKDINMVKSDHVKDINMVDHNETPGNRLLERKNQSLTGISDHVKNINTVDHVKVNTAYCSSNYINNNTTTTTTKKLRLPDCFAWTEKTKKFALDLVQPLPPDQQQFALDYVDDAYQAGEQGISRKINNPIGYLKTIIDDIRNNTLGPSSYGLRSDKNQNQNKPDRSSEMHDLQVDIRHLDKMIQLTPEPTRQELINQQENLKLRLRTMMKTLERGETPCTTGV